MTIDERKSSGGIANSNVIQNVILENREKLSISGVLDVLSFDDQIVILETELGLLTVKGENLRINKLSLDTAEVIVDGEIYNLQRQGYDISIDKSNRIQIPKSYFKKCILSALDQTELSGQYDTDTIYEMEDY